MNRYMKVIVIVISLVVVTIALVQSIADSKFHFNDYINKIKETNFTSNAEQVIIEVNGNKIYQKDFDKLVVAFEASNRSLNDTEIKEKLIRRVLIEIAIKDHNIKSTSKEVLDFRNDALNAMNNDQAAKQIFDAFLKENNLNYDQYIEMMLPSYEIALNTVKLSEQLFMEYSDNYQKSVDKTGLKYYQNADEYFEDYIEKMKRDAKITHF